MCSEQIPIAKEIPSYMRRMMVGDTSLEMVLKQEDLLNHLYVWNPIAADYPCVKIQIPQHILCPPWSASRFSSLSFLGNFFYLSVHVMLLHMLILLPGTLFAPYCLTCLTHSYSPFKFLCKIRLLLNLSIYSLYIFKSLVWFLRIEMIQYSVSFSL